MAVLDRQSQQLTQTLFAGQCLAAVVLAVHILVAASQLSTRTGLYVGRIAGLQIYELSRQVLAGGGFSGSIRFLPRGLLIYFGVVIIISLALGQLRSKKEGL